MKTKARAVRVADELWDEASAIAEAEGSDASKAVRWGLEMFVRTFREGGAHDHEAIRVSTNPDGSFRALCACGHAMRMTIGGA